jgi:hypothetical protein
MARTKRRKKPKPRNATLAACQPGALRTRVVPQKHKKHRPRKSNRTNKELGVAA